jgi:hypothetical protein
MLGCVTYLYPDEDKAGRGVRAGGTGFLVGIRLDGWPPSGPAHLYAVTARHVITGIPKRHIEPSPVIRLHRNDGTVQVVPKRVDQWREHPAGNDLAICPLGLSIEYAPLLYVERHNFVTAEAIRRHNLGIGNTVYVLGRFIRHDGHQRNTPTVRFGNIAMTGGERIDNDGTGRPEESFLIDTHMRAGYSGSPVFVIQFAHERPHAAEAPPAVINIMLGVLWGFLYDQEIPIRDKRGKGRLADFVVDQNAGLAGVVPAWKINDLLDLEELEMARQVAEDELEERNEQSPAVPAGATEEGEDFDFEADLRKASQRIPDQGLSGTSADRPPDDSSGKRKR